MINYYLRRISYFILFLFVFQISYAQSPITVTNSTSVNDNTHCNEIGQGKFYYFIKITRTIRPMLTTAVPITFDDELASYKYYRRNLRGELKPVFYNFLFPGEYMIELNFHPEQINSFETVFHEIDLEIIYQLGDRKQAYTDHAIFKDCEIVVEDDDIESPHFTSNSDHNNILKLDKTDLQVLNNISNASSSLIIENRSHEPLSLYLVSSLSGNYIPIFQNKIIELGRQSISLEEYNLGNGHYQAVLIQSEQIIKEPLIIIK